MAKRENATFIVTFLRQIRDSKRHAITARLALAFVLAAALVVVTGDRVWTYGQCGVAVSSDDGYYYYSTGDYINDVTFNERPAYMYVWWGDGAYYYAEQNWAGNHTFSFDHTYASLHTDHSGYLEIGVYGGSGNEACISVYF